MSEQPQTGAARGVPLPTTSQAITGITGTGTGPGEYLGMTVHGRLPASRWSCTTTPRPDLAWCSTRSSSLPQAAP